MAICLPSAGGRVRFYSENKRLAVCKEQFADFIGDGTKLCLKFWTILCKAGFGLQAFSMKAENDSQCVSGRIFR